MLHCVVLKTIQKSAADKVLIGYYKTISGKMNLKLNINEKDIKITWYNSLYTVIGGFYLEAF